MTVRVPRYYLSEESREQVCTHRAVWGTDIYTDDSDPLAAAIHAGWIRGAWGNAVDTLMLEFLQSDSKATIDPAQTTFTSPPASPTFPRPGKDLHLTLLILPTLEDYASRVMHGIKSRPWGSNHDGVSYRIEKIAWVDEKGAKGQERGGEARRRRISMRTGLDGNVSRPLKLDVGVAKRSGALAGPPPAAATVVV